MPGTDSEDTDAEGDYSQEVAYVLPEGDETTCSICHAEFLDSEDLNVHVNQVHTESKTFSKFCQFCDATYTDDDAYARHICDDHLIQLLCCVVCTKCFTEGFQWRRHMKKHKNKGNTFACSQCTAIFSSPKEVEAHEIFNHDNKEDGLFLTCMPHLSALLKQNIVAYLQSEDRVLTCAGCKFITTDLSSFLNHLTEECHVYVCNLCCFVTNGRKNLIKHLHRKTRCKQPVGYQSEMTNCSTCKTKVHCRQMHVHLNNCNKYKCYVCDIRFVTIDSLSEHQAEFHPVELDILKCKFCSKEFVGQASLEKHMKRTHSHQYILYKYKCKICDSIFKHPQLLFAHYFTKHKELEPYTCKICDKKFRVRKRFTIHIKLEHKSAGVVEFDDQYHVFFAEKKSDNPFIPKCVIPEMIHEESPMPSIKVRTQQEINAEACKKDNQDDLPTETEIDEENDDVLVEKPKLKPKGKKRMRETINLSSSEEEAEPLSLIKKRAERKRFQRSLAEPGTKKSKQDLNLRKQFTCKDCNKYCYTYQNYHNHLQLHKREDVKCIKCSKTFKSRNKLSQHMAKDHATSKLTETLKNVLERKQGEAGNNDVSHDERDEEDLTPSERFIRTIKKVKPDKQSVLATIAPASGDLSAKNFIENFVPDVTESTNAKPTQKHDDSEPKVRLRHYDSPFYRKNTIVMTKFIPEPPVTTLKLKMPERFKAPPQEKIKLRVRLVQGPLKVSMFDQLESFQTKFSNVSYEENHQEYDDIGDHNYDYEDCNDTIPEVAQEVMLEGTEEPPKPNLHTPQKIVIPKLPDGYPKIHIATLQTQAPFFKIITVKNVDNSNEAIVIDTDEITPVTPNMESGKKKDVISLPDGTKYITANPLSHLLGSKQVQDLQLGTKYYKPVRKNIKGIFTEALQNLDKPTIRVKKMKKKPENEDKGAETSGEAKSLPLL